MTMPPNHPWSELVLDNRGYVWLKMPAPDGDHLLELECHVTHWPEWWDSMAAAHQVRWVELENHWHALCRQERRDRRDESPRGRPEWLGSTQFP